MENMKILSLCLAFALLAACTNEKIKESSRTNLPPATAFSTHSEKEVEVIDIISLQKFLRMDYPAGKLGYFEKTFNTCQVGFGYSSTENCHQMYSITVHYQLKCRHSEGSVNTILSDADLTPIESSNVKWYLKNEQGLSATDVSGFGQIQLVSKQSQRNQRLRIAVGENFLYLRASEITKVVTPQDWCP